MITFRKGVLLLVYACLWGCSSSNEGSLALDASGKHVSGWVVASNGGNHPAAYLAAPGTCQECHGVNLTGGVSKVSCFSADRNGIGCHPQGPSGHPAGWSAAASHGAHAKAAATGANGMAFCANCHGADYRGAGVSQKDCLSCHTTAPHPPKPWFGGTSTHKSTDTSNAPACALCHTNRANLSATGAATLPAGVVIGTSGCFNNTLCHGQLGHPDGWAASGHQPAAKAAASATTGMDYCRNCHGSDFRGGSAGISCFGCHTNAPHAKPWLGSTGATTRLHSTTDATNAPACGSCHAGGVKLTTPVTPPANAGCFNSTLCHGTVASHAFPNPGSSHKSSTSGCSSCHSIGTASSQYPPTTAGTPPDCKSCHKLSAAASIALMTGCSDCHGDAASGRPNGSTFPNIARRHSNPGEHAVACTFCHEGGGTGTVTHGNSNNTVKTAANVILNGTSSGMSIIRNAGTGTVTCNGTCHGESHSGKSW